MIGSVNAIAVKKDEFQKALANLSAAMEHLERAIEKTEQSRAALHEAGRECWVDKLDHENGQG